MRDDVTAAITRAITGTAPGTGARVRALASVRWGLEDALGRHVGVDDQARAALVDDPALATVWDGRDNERTRRAFMEALLGVRLQAVLLPADNGAIGAPHGPSRRSQ